MSDVDIISCDPDEDSLGDVDVVAALTADNTSTDGSNQADGDRVRSKRRKQLLAERNAATNFSDVSLCLTDVM